MSGIRIVVSCLRVLQGQYHRHKPSQAGIRASSHRDTGRASQNLRRRVRISGMIVAVLQGIAIDDPDHRVATRGQRCSSFPAHAAPGEMITSTIKESA
jgi:hypothetical protein